MSEFLERTRAPAFPLARRTGVGAPPDTPLEGLPRESAFYRMIIEGQETINTGLAEQDVIAAGRRLIERHPEVGAMVVECANMPPYSTALRRAVNLPIYDSADFVHWFYRSLSPHRFPRT